MKFAFVVCSSVMAGVAAAGTFEDRFFYTSCSFGREDEVAQTTNLIDRAARAGYNGVVLGATYYDTDTLEARSTPDVKNLRKFSNVTGVMYTTWRRKFELLEPFSAAFFRQSDKQ